ncbi:MAG TPA: hypothetical protein VHY91_23105 [Pirellulales bacterium]|nr:hypothetical protein [Pirellulales bacterium]
MGRAYAGVLGPLAFSTVLAHGLIHSASAQETLWRAAVALGAFAIIGCVAGQIAGQIVEDAVRGRLTAEMAQSATEKPATRAR